MYNCFVSVYVYRMTIPFLDIRRMDFKNFCPESDLLGVQQFLKDLEFPTPPLSPDQDIKDTDLENTAPLLPELPASLPTDASNLDLDTVFQIPGFINEADLFEKDLNLYGNLEISNSTLPLGRVGNSPEMYTPAPSPLAEISGPIEEAEESCNEDFSSEANQEKDEVLNTSQLFTYSATAMTVDPNHRSTQGTQQQEEIQQREHEARLSRKREREERRSSNGSKRQALMSYNGRRPASTDSETGE